MQSFTTIIAASALLVTGVTASPIRARDVCGAAPAGTVTRAPLLQPTGIETAAACQAKCEATSSCESFLFGLVNNAPECILYAVPASEIPVQTNANLVAYDLACTSVPAVVPTAANPKGLTLKLAARADICGAAPSATATQTPLAAPSGIDTAAACQVKGEAETGCESFLFGLVNSAPKCILFAVPASEIPVQTNANLIAYDLACTSVPAVVPTAANPKGLASKFIFIYPI